MSTTIRPHSNSHSAERAVGRVFSLIWVAAVAFFPAEVVGYAIGDGQIANVAWLAIIAGGAFAILQWERMAALVMVPLVLIGGIAILVSATMQSSVNMTVVMTGILPAFVIPGLLGAALLLHSERG